VLAHTIHPIPTVGAPAPAFELPSTGGTTIDLASFRGRRPVLVAFFPLAFTSTCTKELCSFTDDYNQFAGTGTAILPISVDSTATLKEYKAKLGLSVDLLSDFKREVSARYGVLNLEKYYANRSYFLMDKSGIVRWAHVEAMNGNRRENAEILARIAQLG
jgi:peroxiredoxin